LIYGTPIGIKVVNIVTNRCVRIIGKQETMRCLNMSLCRAVPLAGAAQSASAPEAAQGPSDSVSYHRSSEPDPMLVVAAYKKARFFLFTNTEPFRKSMTENERDVFNEKNRAKRT